MSKFIANVKDLCGVIHVTIVSGLLRATIRLAFLIGREDMIVKELYDQEFYELLRSNIDYKPTNWIDELWLANVYTMYYFIKDMREKYEA